MKLIHQIAQNNDYDTFIKICKQEGLAVIKTGKLPDMKEILTIVAKRYGYTFEQVYRTCRDAEYVRARHIFIYLLFTLFKHPDGITPIFPDVVVANFLNQHRTNILAARNKIAKELEIYTKFREELEYFDFLEWLYK